MIRSEGFFSKSLDFVRCFEVCEEFGVCRGMFVIWWLGVELVILVLDLVSLGVYDFSKASDDPVAISYVSSINYSVVWF